MTALRNPPSLPTCWAVALITLLLMAGSTLATSGVEESTWVPTRSANDANTRKGFDNFYNLDYDKSIREFEAALQAHPDDPLDRKSVV